MRYRIDYRWILTTTVVVGAAGVGTAAIMRQGGRFGAAPAPSSAELALLNPPSAQAEPALLSHESRISRSSLPPFESEALPPLTAANRGRFGEAARFSEMSAPAWGARSRDFAGGHSAGGSRSGHGGGGGGVGGGAFGGGSAPGGSVTRAHGTGTPTPADHSVTSSSHSSGDASHGSGAPPRSGSASGAAGHNTVPGNPSDSNSAGTTAPVASPTEPAVDHATPGAYGPSRNPISAPPPVSQTPEPGSLMLIGTGIAGMLGALRRRLL